jgi:hypothetical protein
VRFDREEFAGKIFGGEHFRLENLNAMPWICKKCKAHIHQTVHVRSALFDYWQPISY